MSEVYKPRGEQQEQSDSSAEHHRGSENLQHQAEKRNPMEKKHKLQEARSQVAEHSRKSADIQAHHAHNKPRHPKEVPVSRELKAMAYDRALIRIRKNLSPVGRAASRVIHQPVVNAVSEATGKTVARPSGLLGGGLVAFLGTSAYYYFVRHNNYVYRPSVFLALLLGGFILGWLAEGFFRLLHRSK